MLSVGFLRLEVPDLGEQVPAGATVNGCGPADDVRAPTEQHEDLVVPVGSGPETAIYALSACRARVQRCRGRGDAVRVLAMLLSGVLACRPTVASAQQHLPGGHCQLNGGG